MAVGPVNQSLLQSYYQEPGDIYSDIQTESALQVIVDQVNANAAIFQPGGSELIAADPITGLSSTTVYDQMVEMEAQIQAATGGVVPPNTVTTAMLQDGAVTHPKLSPGEQTASVGGIIYANLNLGGW